MQCVTRPRIKELNAHLLCVLCGGYYIDATAIIECLHSFCKSCIVRYLETHKYCPICDVLVHKTKPLQNLRPDTILQSLVYKLIPNLYTKELRNRRNYYAEVQPTPFRQIEERKGEITQSSVFYSDSDMINFTLEYINYLSDQNFCYVASNSKRYFRCRASVSIKHLRKLVEAKYISTAKHDVRFFYEETQLPEYLTFLDVAYISSWQRHGYIRLLYQILEVRKTVVETKLEPSSTPVASSHEIPSSPQTLNICMPTESASSIEVSADVSSKINTTNHTKEQPKILETSTVSHELKSTVTDENCTTTAESTQFPSCNISSALSPSTSSVTVTCSINSDNITVSSVETPITTSTCAISVNNSLPTMNILQVAENTVETEQNKPLPDTIVKNSIPSTESTESKSAMEVVEDKFEKQGKSALSMKRPLDTSESSSMKASTNESTCSPNPTKMLKLSEPTRKENPVNQLASKNVLEIRTTTSTTSNTSTSSATLSVTAVTYTTPSISGASSLKMSTSVEPLSKIDIVQKSTPRPIFTRSEVPMITKSTTKIMKTFTRPWNLSTSACSSATDSVEVKDKLKPMKIIKARNTPRYLGNPASGIRPIFQTTSIMSTGKPMKPENAKKSVKNLPVMKIDPQTLSPIATTTNSVVAPTSSSSPKKSYPYLPVTSELYTNSGAFTNSGLSTYTSSSNLAAKTSSYVMPSSLLPMNQLMYEMYGNGARTLEFMKAMTTNFCGPMFPPLLHPSFYSSLQSSKYEKSRGIKSLDKSPPAVQRIPPSNNNTKVSTNEHSNEEKKNLSVKHDNLSNGQLKSNKKKTSEMSSFSINNLIPLEMVKHVTHSCSADGINQICDQMPQNNNKKK